MEPLAKFYAALSLFAVGVAVWMLVLINRLPE